jgi:methylase of polypeptide subunit release factors
MNDENKSIHEFDFELICEYFSNLERQGPGSPEVTIKALSFIDNLNDKSLIADIGCGSGGQTMVLAQHAPGNVTGIDLFPIFIDMFNRNVEKLNLPDRVKGIVGSIVVCLALLDCHAMFHEIFSIPHDIGDLVDCVLF